MDQRKIKLYNVVEQTNLPEIPFDQIPAEGDPIEIGGEMYYVCDKATHQNSDYDVLGVIPLVVRNPSNVRNIKEYINCLSIAHRRVLFKRENGGSCDLESCDEMIIT
jgi:hypothetical protein